MIPSVDLLSACPFAILAGTTITDVPPSIITGDVGLSPGGGAAILVSCVEVTGNIYAVDAAGPVPCAIMNPALLTQAKADLVTAYNQALGLIPTMPVDTPISGVLTPGVYPYSAAALTGAAVTFTGVGDFVFQIPTTLTVPVGAVFTIAGGADARRIFFVVGSSATINSGVTFKGNILALTSISAGTLSNIEGKLLARNGAVTLDTNTINSNSCFVQCPTITFGAIPVTGVVGVAYNGDASASPVNVYNYTIIAGALPNGLALNPVSGAITGVPTTAGIFNFTAQAEDGNGCIGTQPYVITISEAVVCPVIIIVPESIPSGFINRNYRKQLIISQLVPVNSFIIISGELPDGLTLSDTGVISGRPTVRGLFNFVVQASDANFCSGSRAFVINVTSARGGNSFCLCD